MSSLLLPTTPGQRFGQVLSGSVVVRALVAPLVTVSDPATPKPGALNPPVDLERLRSGLRIIALRALGDADAADDAVQEALSRAIEALAAGRLEDPSRLAAYVAGIVRHVCAHVLRDRKDTLAIDDDAARVQYPELQTHFDPLEALIGAAESERLTKAFGALAPDEQRLLRLCFHEGRTPGDIASELGEPAERVRKRKSRALERLRRAFLGDASGHDEVSGGTSTVAPLMPNDHIPNDND
jgi:RNA polymerase sigma factor (sigma-70 family)